MYGMYEMHDIYETEIVVNTSDGNSLKFRLLDIIELNISTNCITLVHNVYEVKFCKYDVEDIIICNYGLPDIEIDVNVPYSYLYGNIKEYCSSIEDDPEIEYYLLRGEIISPMTIEDHMPLKEVY